MSLLLRKRTVSAKAALKLLDDSHAALHFNREILQTALNHVRQGIAVFDADLQLICSNRQFGEILGAAAAPGADRDSAEGNPRIHGRDQPARLRRRRRAAGNAAGRLHHRRRALSGAPAGSPHGDRGARQPDARRRARHHLLRRHAELRGGRSAGTRQRDAGKARARPHRGTDAAEFGTGAGQEHRRGRQHLEDALPGGGEPRHPAAAECGAALCDEPGRAPERRRGFAAGRKHRRFAGGDRGDPRRAAGYLAARRRRHDAVDHEFQDRRPDALARDRIRADRARQGAEADLRALLAAGGIRPRCCCGGCCRT